MSKPIITDESDRYEWIASGLFDLGMYMACDEVRKMGEELAAARTELAEYAKTVAHMRDGARLQDSATAAVMERAEKAEAELAACREDADRYRWMERNWYRAYDVVAKCSQPFTSRMGELADRVRTAIDAARKEGA
jgi:DNA repair ATPase RecN